MSTKEGHTALGLACKKGHKAIAELLICKGASVNSQNNVRLVNYCWLSLWLEDQIKNEATSQCRMA